MEKKDFTRKKLMKRHPYVVYKNYTIGIGIFIIIIILLSGFDGYENIIVNLKLIAIYCLIAFVIIPILCVKRTIDFLFLKIEYIEGILFKFEKDYKDLLGLYVIIATEKQKKKLYVEPFYLHDDSILDYDIGDKIEASYLKNSKIVLNIRKSEYKEKRKKRKTLTK